MTAEEVEDVVRALTAAVENLEAGGARQSMQEAFTQLRAYAGAERTSTGEAAALANRGSSSPMDADRWPQMQPYPRTATAKA